MTHAQARALERYWINLGDADLAEIAALIITNNPLVRFFRPARDCCQCWEVWWQGEVLHVIWDPRRAYIVTVLPRAATTKRGRRIFCETRREENRRSRRREAKKRYRHRRREVSSPSL